MSDLIVLAPVAQPGTGNPSTVSQSIPFGPPRLGGRQDASPFLEMLTGIPTAQVEGEISLVDFGPMFQKDQLLQKGPGSEEEIPPLDGQAVEGSDGRFPVAITLPSLLAENQPGVGKQLSSITEISVPLEQIAGNPKGVMRTIDSKGTLGGKQEENLGTSSKPVVLLLRTDPSHILASRDEIVQRSQINGLVTDREGYSFNFPRVPVSAESLNSIFDPKGFQPGAIDSFRSPGSVREGMASSDFSLSSGNPGGVAIGEPRTLGPNSQVHRPLVPGPNLIGNGQLAAVEFIQGETINRHLLEKSHPLSVIQEVRGNQATEFSQLTQGVDGKVGGNSQDPGSDRHAGTGMTFSNQFHQGQTSSSSSQQGATRFGIFEERLQAFTPGPPHKIQMEVQLSDATRLQVEVAVQQRQVYAGLLVDQPAFRALALQNQPQLEAQLNQVGLELREFGAEIEDQAKNSREALGDQGQERGRSTTTENEVEGIRSQEKRIKVEQESTQGFHYVA